MASTKAFIIVQFIITLNDIQLAAYLWKFPPTLLLTEMCSWQYLRQPLRDFKGVTANSRYP